METKLTISKESLKQNGGFVYTHTQEELNQIMKQQANAKRGQIAQYTDTQSGQTFCQINKRKAEKMFNQGYTVYMHPHKMRVNNVWQNPTPTNRAGGEFSKTLNAFIYYNCNTESGRYPNYYVLLDDLIGFNLCGAIAGGNNTLTTK